MVKNALADSKNNHIAKNEMEMGKYSLWYHAHKISRLSVRTMIKGTQLNFKKECFIELNCLAIKRYVSSASLSGCYTLCPEVEKSFMFSETSLNTNSW